MHFFSFWKFGYSNSVDLVDETTENHLGVFLFVFFIAITGQSLSLLNLGFPFPWLLMYFSLLDLHSQDL